MNTGQTMLTIAALVLLSVISLNYYRSMGQTGSTLASSNVGFTATTVATSFLERVQGYRFDEYSDTVAVQIPDSTKFTLPANLGITQTEIDSGEVKGDYNTYDDIDDFDKDTLLYQSEWNNERFKVSFRVYYVNPWTDSYTEVTTSQTFLKRIDVKVKRVIASGDTTSVEEEANMTTLHGFYFFNPI